MSRGQLAVQRLHQIESWNRIAQRERRYLSQRMNAGIGSAEPSTPTRWPSRSGNRLLQNALDGGQSRLCLPSVISAAVVSNFNADPAHGGSPRPRPRFHRRRSVTAKRAFFRLVGDHFHRLQRHSWHAEIDRSGGGADLGVPRVALKTMKVISYQPDECPLCREGSAAVKPGSRA